MLLNPTPQSKIEHYGKQQLSNETLFNSALSELATYPSTELQLND